MRHNCVIIIADKQIMMDTCQSSEESTLMPQYGKVETISDFAIRKTFEPIRTAYMASFSEDKQHNRQQLANPILLCHS